jgi:hypothetical protein
VSADAGYKGRYRVGDLLRCLGLRVMPRSIDEPHFAAEHLGEATRLGFGVGEVGVGRPHDDENRALDTLEARFAFGVGIECQAVECLVSAWFGEVRLELADVVVVVGRLVTRVHLLAVVGDPGPFSPGRGQRHPEQDLLPGRRWDIPDEGADEHQAGDRRRVLDGGDNRRGRRE